MITEAVGSLAYIRLHARRRLSALRLTLYAPPSLAAAAATATD